MRAVFRGSVGLLALACSQADLPSGDSPIDLSTASVVDLSHTYDETTVYWPTSPSSFELEILHRGPTEAGFYYEANTISTPEHGGTHLDAPIHFAEGAWATDQIPLDRLIGPAAVIDVSSAARRDPDYLLTEEDVAAWEADHGPVPQGAIVMMRTDWSHRWPNRRDYMGDDAPGDASDLHFPGYGEAAARLLVEGRRVAVLGIDTASIDHGPSRYFLAHQVAGGANVAALENVTNLDQLPPSGAWIVALPMKIGRGSGGPARIAAILP